MGSDLFFWVWTSYTNIFNWGISRCMVGYCTNIFKLVSSSTPFFGSNEWPITYTRRAVPQMISGNRVVHRQKKEDDRIRWILEGFDVPYLAERRELAWLWQLQASSWKETEIELEEGFSIIREKPSSVGPPQLQVQRSSSTGTVQLVAAQRPLRKTIQTSRKEKITRLLWGLDVLTERANCHGSTPICTLSDRSSSSRRPAYCPL